MSTRKQVAVIFFLLCVLATCVLIKVLPSSEWSGPLGFVEIILFMIVGFALYFLPAYLAITRKHHQVGPIIIINLLLGWTFLGWVVAFAWSLSETRSEQLPVSPN